MKKDNILNYQKKNHRKIVRTVLQLITLVILFSYLFVVIFYDKKYKDFDSSIRTNRDGFIALSYFGVSRSGSETLISRDQLDKELGELKKQGYTTISQQDIIDYYEKEKPLPKKALFLSFEDGRNDSVIYVQPLLEKYNFKATIFTYANKFGEKDHKFLQPKEIKKMLKSGYWEIGSNGYQLKYINVYDNENRYLGIKNEEEFTNEYTSYTHYLMDFIREENGIPIENRDKMEERISKDYKRMKEIYNKEFDYFPKAYMIMHANYLYNGMNRLVEDINNHYIQELFQLHFNREGSVVNNKSNDNIYDLSRLQPAPYWSINHFLLKLKIDTGDDIQMQKGDLQLANGWEVKNGIAEFLGNNINLTSFAGKRGMITLKKSEGFEKNLNLSVNVKVKDIPNNRQSIYVRYDQEKNTYLRISIENGEISITKKVKQNSTEQILETSKLSKGPEHEINIISLEGKTEVEVNGKSIFKDIDSKDLEYEIIALATEYKHGENKSLLENDIYYKGYDISDGFFSDFEVNQVDSNGEKLTQLYSNKYTGIQKIYNNAKYTINLMVNWAMATF